MRVRQCCGPGEHRGEATDTPHFWLARQQKNPQRTLRASSEECEGPRQTGLSKPATGSEWRAICFTPPPRACVCVPPRSAARERETRRERLSQTPDVLCRPRVSGPRRSPKDVWYWYSRGGCGPPSHRTSRVEARTHREAMCSRSKRGARCNPVPCECPLCNPEREGRDPDTKTPTHTGERATRAPRVWP